MGVKKQTESIDSYRKLSVAEIIFMKISSPNFLRVPKAMQCFSLKFSPNVIFGIAHFRDVILESSQNVCKTTLATRFALVTYTHCIGAILLTY